MVVVSLDIVTVVYNPDGPAAALIARILGKLLDGQFIERLLNGRGIIAYCAAQFYERNQPLLSEINQVTKRAAQLFRLLSFFQKPGRAGRHAKNSTSLHGDYLFVFARRLKIRQTNS
jgi:hypothetical protein